MSAMQELNGLPRIPSAWRWSTIRNACLKVQDGTHFSPQNQLAQGAYRYITAKNVRPFGLDLSNVSYLAEDEHRAIYKRCDPKKGDVLLVKDGVNTGDAAVNTLDEEFSLLSSVCLLRPRPELLFSQFLRYYLLSPVGYRMLTGQMTGTAIKRIILGRIKESPVPIAPLDEQRTIVAEIEKQFSRLDEAVANLKRVKANLKRYKASVLKAAVEGKLTEDWRKQHPDVEPASKLLERILAERRAKWDGRGKYKEPDTLDASGLPLLPNSWEWVSLDQLLLNITDGDHQPPPQTNSGVPFLVIGNVRSGKLKFEGSRFVSRQYADGVDGFRKPTRGDILYTLVGSFGIALRVDSDQEFCIQRHIGVFRPHKLSPTAYLVHALNSLFIFLQATKVATGTAQKTVPLVGLRRFAIPLAPQAEQQQIVTEVERRLSIIEELETSVEANLTRADRLRQSILSQAFSGRLLGRDTKHIPDILPTFSIAAEGQARYGKDSRAPLCQYE